MLNNSYRITKSGVQVFDDFRDNLVVDRDAPEVHRKAHTIASENSEDAATWNMFRFLLKVDPTLWFPGVFRAAFPGEEVPPISGLEMNLWKSQKAPIRLGVSEGETEADVVMETRDWVWVIEAKLGSALKSGTANDPNRNQLLRNIDYGADYAIRGDCARSLYVSVLVRSDKDTPNAREWVQGYLDSPDSLVAALGHRPSGIPYLRGVSLFYWKDVVRVVDHILSSGRLSRDLEPLGKALLAWCATRGILV